MKIEINPEVEVVARFMTANIPAAELLAVATELALLAPSLWRRKDEPESIAALRLVSPKTSSGRTQSSASE